MGFSIRSNWDYKELDVMPLSQKCKQTVDACRFCWMCRHICPIGNVTGQERNNARARALALSMVVRNVEGIDDVIENMYECTLCGACTKECMTGWDPVRFTLEARLEGVMADVTPDYILRLMDNFSEVGNIYGKKELAPELAAEIATLPKSAKKLLFLGRDTLYFAPKSAIAAIKLLKKAGLNFTVLTDEPDSGFGHYFLVGPAEEVRQIAKATAAKLAFDSIIVYDPNDAKMFLREYKEWGVELGAGIQTFTSCLAELIAKGALQPKKNANVVYTFQDPYALARDLEDTASARAVLDACGSQKEMLLNGKDTVIAGHLIMREYLPDVIADVAKQRLENAKNADAKILVTASPAEYVCLKDAQPDDLEIMSIEEVVLKCL